MIENLDDKLVEIIEEFEQIDYYGQQAVLNVIRILGLYDKFIEIRDEMGF